MSNNRPDRRSLQGDRRKSSAASLPRPGPAAIGWMNIKVSGLRRDACKSAAEKSREMAERGICQHLTAFSVSHAVSHKDKSLPHDPCALGDAPPPGVMHLCKFATAYVGRLWGLFKQPYGNKMCFRDNICRLQVLYKSLLLKTVKQHQYNKTKQNKINRCRTFLPQ